MANSAKQTHGVTEKPIQCNRILVKTQDGSKFAGAAVSVLAINDKTKTVTSVNIYDADSAPRTGKGYNAVQMTQPLPASGDAKWKKWNKDYEAKHEVDGQKVDWKPEDFSPVLELVEVEATVGQEA